jgi:hypothetical protein
MTEERSQYGADIQQTFSDEEEQPYHVETDQLLNFWNAKSGVSSESESASDRDHVTICVSRVVTEHTRTAVSIVTCYTFLPAICGHIR